MFPSQNEQNKNFSYRQTLAHLFATSTSSLRRLNFASWLRMALVFTIVTGGLLVAFFGITVRVQAATATRFTPAAPPTSQLRLRAILLNRIPRSNPRARIIASPAKPNRWSRGASRIMA